MNLLSLGHVSTLMPRGKYTAFCGVSNLVADCRDMPTVTTQKGGPVRAIALILVLHLFAIPACLAQGKIQPDPSIACTARDFKPHELCFETPKDEIARAEFLSEHFYAVILVTAERCTLSEEERAKVQGLFPKTKVFSMRFQCDDDIEEDISYTNVNDKFGFLAVYAGRTLKEAKARLAEVKATGKFPGANIRRMQAMLVYP